MKKTILRKVDEILKADSKKEEIENITENEYKKLKLNLKRIQQNKKDFEEHPFLFLITISCLLVLIFIVEYLDNNYQIEIVQIVRIIIASIAFGTLFKLIIEGIINIKEIEINKKILEYEVENIKDEVQEDLFENSVKMSYKYLDQYYLQTRDQAQKGFWITFCISIFGALLIGGGIIAMFMEKTSPSYITCASGVITEFIAAIFFYLYNRTITSMSKYHNKLVLSHNIAIALKISESLPNEEKLKAKNLIITELMKNVNAYLIKSEIEKEDKG